MTKEELEKMIFHDKMSYVAIGKKYGVTGAAIKKRALKMGIVLPHKRAINPKEIFSHPREHHFAVCPICGKSFRKTEKEKRITCSIQCAGVYRSQKCKEKNAILLERGKWDGVERKNMWKPMFYVKSNGYLWAKCPNHPNCFKNGYVLAHRIVIENYLGRILRNNEFVHHKDGNKTNNNISNLEVMTLSEHAKHHYYERIKNGCGIIDYPRNCAKGKKTKCGKFDEKDIKNIRDLFSKGYKYKEIAQKYNVNSRNISNIVRNITYKWVY